MSDTYILHVNERPRYKLRICQGSGKKSVLPARHVLNEQTSTERVIGSLCCGFARFPTAANGAT